MIGQTMSMFPCLMKDTIPVDDVMEFEITGPQLKCVSGCDIMSITSIICHRMKDMEQEDEVSTSTAQLSGQHFYCVPSPQPSLPNIALILHKLECQYCDTSEQQLVKNSCSVSYDLVRGAMVSLYDILVALVLVIVLAILLVMLYKEIGDPVHEEKNRLPVGKGDVITCKDLGGRGERRNDEEIFQHGHSLLGGKRRRRSRSRIRKIKE